MIYYCNKCKRYHIDSEMLEEEKDDRLAWVCPDCHSDEIEDHTALSYNERLLVRRLNKYEERIANTSKIASILLEELPKDKIEEVKEKIAKELEK